MCPVLEGAELFVSLILLFSIASVLVLDLNTILWAVNPKILWSEEEA